MRICGFEASLVSTEAQHGSAKVSPPSDDVRNSLASRKADTAPTCIPLPLIVTSCTLLSSSSISRRKAAKATGSEAKRFLSSSVNLS